MASLATPTWQLLSAVLTAITGILLVAGAFSPENPAPFPAILGTGVLLLLLALYLLKLHLAFLREAPPQG